MLKLIPLILFFFFLVPTDLFAEEEKQVGLYVDSPGQLLRLAPGGQDVAKLRHNTPVRLLGKKGEWSNICVDGWIRSAALAQKTPAEVGAGPQKKRKLEITRFGTRMVAPTAKQAAQIYLDLTIKNNTKRPVLGWRAILIVENKLGDVLFNSSVSHDADIEPGETVLVTYFWEEGEKPYRVLLSNPKNTMLLKLIKVELTQ